MRNSNTRCATTKVRLPKCANVFYAFSELQLKYGELLSTREDVSEFKANVKLSNFKLGDTFTSDFVITTLDGKTIVRECVYKSKLLKPLTTKLLDASKEWWLSNYPGVDWGIVIDA